MPASNPKRTRQCLTAAAALLLIGFLVWAGNRLDPGTVAEWKEQVHPLTFFAALVLLPLVGVPMTPFYLLMGVTFGIPLSLMAALTALSVNLLICYLLVTLGLGPLLKRLLEKGGYPLPANGPRRGLRFALVLRLIPAMPNFVKNYILALSGVPLPIYFGTSLPLSFLYAVPLIVLGESVFEQNPLLLGLAAALLLILGLFSWWLRKRLQVSSATRLSH